MNYGNRVLGSNLTFYVVTTRFDTGNRTVADSVPTYRIYEEETATAILTGSMALLDAANTISLYSEQITLSSGSGFENGKDYVIYITATVNAVVGATRHTFRVGTGAAAGAIEFTYTVTDSSSGLPIEGVEIWITTDSAGTNVIWNGDTDALGIARDDQGNKPYLDAGTYYFWRQKAGYTLATSNPDTEVVS